MRPDTLPAALLVWILAGILFPVCAEPSLQQCYLDFYLKVDDAQHLEKQGDYIGALEDFKECSAMLLKIHAADPDWQSALIIHRLADCDFMIIDLQRKASASSSGAPPDATHALVRPTIAKTDPILGAILDHPKTTYPWKTGITTTMFWIGEKGSTASAWNEGWAKSNDGEDSPSDRNGFATGSHASSVNPFYVALPFNDLAFPDKARQWLPKTWHQRIVNGKPISACKDRWVWIKSAEGRSCFAQWEDVGPERDDHPEYVFGNEPAGPAGRPGLSVSPAVAQYLGIGDGKQAITSWRFVDDSDVPPGQWLKYDEQAVLYSALHQIQKSDHK
jgi:hypothetical protein